MFQKKLSRYILIIGEKMLRNEYKVLKLVRRTSLGFPESPRKNWTNDSQVDLLFFTFLFSRLQKVVKHLEMVSLSQDERVLQMQTESASTQQSDS